MEVRPENECKRKMEELFPFSSSVPPERGLKDSGFQPVVLCFGDHESDPSLLPAYDEAK